MALEIDSATDHVELYDRLIAFLQLGITTPGGPNWELIRQDTADSSLFRAPGLTETEEIYVGISLHPQPDIDVFNFGFWMFRAFNDALGDLEQPGHSGVLYHTTWDDTTPYWFVANGQRLMMVTKPSTAYTASYVGKFLPYGLPSEYPQPYYIGCPTGTSTLRWSSVNESHRNFFDPGPHCLLGGPSGVWRAVGNYFEQSGEASTGATNYIHPFAGNVSSVQSALRYRELRDNVDGSYSIFPLTLLGENPELNCYGDLDGAYAVPGFSIASEDIIQIGGDDYLVVQNIFRTDRMYYGAIKLE